MVACAQCRQRKVRCHGGSSSCEACARLGFQCSLGRSSTPTASNDNSSSAPRKRGSRACEKCRAQRSRCSGDSPICHRCQRLNLTCQYTLSVRQYRAKGLHSSRIRNLAPEIGTEIWQSGTMSAAQSTSSAASVAFISPLVSELTRVHRYLEIDSSTIRQHIDAYFEYVYPVPVFSFLHRADFLSQYVSDTLCSALLLLVCAISSRFLPPFGSRPSAAKSWIERAETMLFQRLGKWTVEDLKALMLLTAYCSHSQHSAKASSYLALAVRTAIFLKLHKENHVLPFIEQECRRRLLWCMFTVDRFQAGGVTEYIVLPSTFIHVQLPCPEHNFQIDLAVQSPHLRDHAEAKADLPILNFLLRIFDVRNRILQYTKALLDACKSPEQSLLEFRALEAELEAVYCSLPADLLFNTRAFQLRAFSPERTTFISLHLYYHHCHCELYRILNPGYREALPQAVIQSTSADVVAYAQSKCLQHATAIGDIIATTNDLVRTIPYTSDPSCFVILYQASCAILYACHRDSPVYTMSADTARQYFTVFIRTLAKLLQYFPKFAVFVNDIRNMMRSIEVPGAPLPAQKASTEVDFRARPISSEENSDEETAMAQVIQRSQHDNTSTNISVHVMPDEQLSANLPSDSDYALETYFQYPDYGIEDPMEATNQDLLWDWTKALESGFSL
ncbi:hypothetical protein CC86DRAFT_470803 [Ophiobolus disseminans]|uniref:Zn(2)-C6 fungal-type domain-containing protein n=1 Tax=Ophiobolus disseminans TaxID=1469910 RepID=A0A6A6ZL92_9PLEO|nr:hypothetical protein CC86DRAFT_470803 [Ophiobolus disseminans]